MFASTQVECDGLANDLQQDGFSAVALHGALSQGLRNRRLMALRNGQVQILVATDVVVRGIDVPTITHVFNYGLPMKAEDYTHRIGRTGRAGREGVARDVCGIPRPSPRVRHRRLYPPAVQGRDHSRHGTPAAFSPPLASVTVAVAAAPVVAVASVVVAMAKATVASPASAASAVAVAMIAVVSVATVAVTASVAIAPVLRTCSDRFTIAAATVVVIAARRRAVPASVASVKSAASSVDDRGSFAAIAAVSVVASVKSAASAAANRWRASGGGAPSAEGGDFGRKSFGGYVKALMCWRPREGGFRGGESRGFGGGDRRPAFGQGAGKSYQPHGERGAKAQPSASPRTGVSDEC